MLTTIECWELASRATSRPWTSSRGAKNVLSSAGYPSRNRPSALNLPSSSHTNCAMATTIPFHPFHASGWEGFEHGDDGAGGNHPFEPEASAGEHPGEFAGGTLATAVHDHHVQVGQQALEVARPWPFGDQALNDDHTGAGGDRLAAAPQDGQRLVVVPVVQDGFEEVTVRAGGYGTHEIAAAQFASVGNAGAGQGGPRVAEEVIEVHEHRAGMRAVPQDFGQQRAVTAADVGDDREARKVISGDDGAA